MKVFHRCLLAMVLLLGAWPAHARFDHTHAAWSALLDQHVRWNPAGTTTTVDYAGFADDQDALDAYLQSLAKVPRSQYGRWTWPQRQAFLINAYNAATVQLVLTRYPRLDSIKEIGSWFTSPWEIEFVSLLGQTRSLDGIEHGLLRGAPEYRALGDPRIHFAVNCASTGCPALRPEAYVPARLDAQLRDQTQRFLRDRSRNRVVADPPLTLAVSSIFDWYGDDFAAAGGVTGFLADHAGALGASAAQAAAMRGGDVELRFLDYDWSLNDADSMP